MKDEITQKLKQAAATKDHWARAAKFKEAREMIEREPIEVSPTDTATRELQNKFNAGPAFLRACKLLPKPARIRQVASPSRDVVISVAGVSAEPTVHASGTEAPHGTLDAEDEATLADERVTPEYKLTALLAAIPKAIADVLQRGKRSIIERIEALVSYFHAD